MKKYLPNRTEIAMLTIGIIIGTTLTYFSKNWSVILIIAPIIAIIEFVIYLTNKNKQKFNEDLARAKDKNQIINN